MLCSGTNVGRLILSILLRQYSTVREAQYLSMRAPTDFESATRFNWSGERVFANKSRGSHLRCVGGQNIIIDHLIDSYHRA